VLLVEDEPKFAELLRENLTPHDVTIAHGGDAALALLATDSAFDAIVCDLLIPGIGGIEVHEHLRANKPGVEQRIVFMTGGAFTPRASTFLASVANRCLAKPFAIGSLLRAIDEVARL
jgi:CheY-like chemotaxis protein